MSFLTFEAVCGYRRLDKKGTDEKPLEFESLRFWFTDETAKKINIITKEENKRLQGERLSAAPLLAPSSLLDNQVRMKQFPRDIYTYHKNASNYKGVCKYLSIKGNDIDFDTIDLGDLLIVQANIFCDGMKAKDGKVANSWLRIQPIKITLVAKNKFEKDFETKIPEEEVERLEKENAALLAKYINNDEAENADPIDLD